MDLFTKSPGEVEATIDTALSSHLAPGSHYPLSLGRILWLVVLRQIDGFAFTTENTSGVPNIGHNDLLVSYQSQNGCTTTFLSRLNEKKS